ncbi:hypothetical protein Vlu01_42150 [Micromonospora lutea]|uniref:Alpha-L-arabinofuranosidase B catalytic domain-containing protein n=1 Tax=Micromonospora lutea TaxID=419825 RepID=A0ABQ4J072_9ACTN|nr:hypothetical protein Vlu01_42150 [Micromonospora lutea]
MAFRVRPLHRRRCRVRVRLTPAGEAFLPAARQCLDAAERAAVAVILAPQVRVAVAAPGAVIAEAIVPGQSAAIILGSGGDCCKPDGGANLSAGTFYEGAMVAGYPSDATENAVHASIVAAGYR